MDEMLEQPVSRRRVDRRSGERQALDFLEKPCRQHRRHPAALAEADKLGEMLVDLEILHIQRRGFPVGEIDPWRAVFAQRLDQALSLLIIGNHRRMAGIGRIDDGRDTGGIDGAVFAKPHCAEIEADAIGGCELRVQLGLHLLFLGDEFEVASDAKKSKRCFSDLVEWPGWRDYAAA